MCRQWQDRIWAYVEGHCSAEQVRELEAHLQTCESCQRAVKTTQITLQAVRSLPRYTPPPHLSERVQARLVGSGQQPPGILERPGLLAWLRPQGWSKFAWGLGLVLVLCVGSWLTLSSRDQNNIQTVESRNAVASEEYTEVCVNLHQVISTAEAAPDPTTAYLVTTGYTQLR